MVNVLVPSGQTRFIATKLPSPFPLPHSRSSLDSTEVEGSPSVSPCEDTYADSPMLKREVDFIVSFSHFRGQNTGQLGRASLPQVAPLGLKVKN